MKLKPVKKLRFFILLLALLGLLLLGLLIFRNRHPRGTATTLDQVSILVDRGISSATVGLWREDWPEDGDETDDAPGDGWFFLPSFAHLNQLRFLYDDSSCTLLFDETPLPSGSRIPGIVADGIYTLSFVEADGTRQDLQVHFTQSADLPTIFLQTDSGSTADIRADKTYHEGGSLKVVEANGKLNTQTDLSFLKGHGNQTLGFDKRSFTLKLAEKQSLLGMGTGKNWVLLSNVYDDTQLRNKIMYDLAAELGLPFAVESRYCDVYVNDVYAGLYLLCYKVVLGPNRVDVTDLESQNEALNGDPLQYDVLQSEDGRIQYTNLPETPADLTGGYLLERDYGDKYENDPCWFLTDDDETLVLKSPAYASKAEVEYISREFQQLENAILAPDGIDPESGRYYTDILDLDSWTRMYLLDEFSKQEGAGVTSSWYFKDTDDIDGLIYSGPAWDYDKCLGRYRSWASPQGITQLSLHKYKSSWFSALYQKQDFYNGLVNCYRDELIPLLNDLLDHGLHDYAEGIRSGWNMDKIRWGNHGLYNVISDYDTLDHCVDYLQSWIGLRMDFLQSAWLDGDTWYTVTTDGSLADSEYYYLYAKAGEGVGGLPAARDGEGEFLHWVIAGTDIVFTGNTPVNGDLTLEAVWSGTERPD